MRVIFSFLLILLLAGAVQAQETLSVLSYNISFPLSDMKDFVDNMSWRGIHLEGRKFVNPKFSVGVSGAVNTFHKNTDDILKLEIGDASGDVSGNQFRVARTFPLLATAHYYFQPYSRRGGVIPFAGLRAGTYYLKRRLDIGVVSIDDTNWHFGLSPELGVLIPYRYETGVFLNVKYNYIFSVTDDADYSYIDVNIGFSFSS